MGQRPNAKSWGQGPGAHVLGLQASILGTRPEVPCPRAKIQEPRLSVETRDSRPWGQRKMPKYSNQFSLAEAQGTNCSVHGFGPATRAAGLGLMVSGGQNYLAKAPWSSGSGLRAKALGAQVPWPQQQDQGAGVFWANTPGQSRGLKLSRAAGLGAKVLGAQIILPRLHGLRAQALGPKR